MVTSDLQMKFIPDNSPDVPNFLSDRRNWTLLARNSLDQRLHATLACQVSLSAELAPISPQFPLGLTPVSFVKARMTAMILLDHAAVRTNLPEETSDIEGLLGRFGKLFLYRCNQTLWPCFMKPFVPV